MFKNLKQNKIYRFTFEVDKILEPYWELIKIIKGDDLFKNGTLFRINEEFGKSPLHQEYIEYTKGGLSKEKIDDIKDSYFNNAFNIIIKKLTDSILKNDILDKYIQKSCLYIIKETPLILIGEGEGEAEEKYITEFHKYLKNGDILTNFFKQVNISTSNIKNIFNPILCKNVIPHCDNISDIENPIYPWSIINKNKVRTGNFDKNILWINKKLAIKKYNINVDNIIAEKVFSRSDNEWIGLKLNEYFTPIITDFKDKIDNSKKTLYIWYNIKNGIYENKKEDKDSLHRCECFLENIKDEYFTNMLSYLEYNLYTEDSNIPDKYKYFFEKLIKIDDLTRLSNYKILAPENENNEAILGIYKINKEYGESDYNLLHYVTSNNTNLTKWSSLNTKDKSKKEPVLALKAEYAYYYISKYFEQYFEKLLKDIKDDGVKIEYKMNLKIKTSKEHEYEIDSIVYAKNNIYIIELKTNLSINYIREYQKKCDILNSDLIEISDHVKFIIIGSYSKEELDIFNPIKKQKHNIKRPGLKTIPYYFNVPINNSEFKKMLCLAESNYDILKKILIKEFNK